MAQPGEPDGERPDDGQHKRGLWSVSLFVGAFAIGTLLVQLFKLPELPTWAAVVSGLCGATLLGVLAALSSDRMAARLREWVATLPRWLRQLWPSTPRQKLISGLALVIGLILSLLFRNLVDGAQAAKFALLGCPHPVELRVLSSPDGLTTAKQLTDRYREQAARSNHGCAPVSVYTYAASPKQIAQAMADQWSGTSLRDVGPRPDVWLADSGTDLDKINASATDPAPVAEQHSVASSPLVLGTSDPAAAAALDSQRPGTWAQTLERASRADRGLLRPDPSSSTMGELATALLYGLDSPADQARARSVEQLIGRSLDRDRYPIGDSLELLCRHRDVTPQRSAVIVSEQALVRFNTGAPLGDKCVTAVDRLPPQQQLKAFYPSDTRSMDYRFVRMGWSSPDQEREAARFGQWLSSTDGKQALVGVGLRPPEFTAREPLSEQNGVLPGVVVRTDPIAAQALRAAMQQFEVAHRQGRVLLAVDASGSMGAAAGAGKTRFTVAAQGVRRALELMGQGDEFGLWLFPGGATPVREAVPIGQRDGPVNGVPRRDAAAAALDQTAPGGGTPLLRAIRDGVAAVGPSADTRVSALVVLTDGEDTASGIPLAQVRTAVAAQGVRVFVIAVGETRCASEALRVLSADSAGACYDAEFDSVGARLVDVFGALWGKAGN